ncbi:glutamate carboxypeptidase 2-like [Daphnia pulex]|uniref:glutamate carboxypeptidase 2-like n=1 Tax=Daphnia pulex TaxID=6669 RepID=UPI001EE00CC4|nr:glutamate carboxypeptidase 2-like [Daphnia pulex]
METKNLVISFAILYVVTGVAIGVGLYYAGYNADHSPAPKMDVFQQLQNEISADKISGYLKNLSSVPHLAGTAQDYEQAVWLHDNFVQSGLDRVVIVPYQVLLSYPNMTQPNIVRLLDDKGLANITTSGKQTPISQPEEFSELAAPNFNAYSGQTGLIESDGLVYAHYGQMEDFEYLESVGVNVSGKIVLARYGASFRANIVDLAQRKGAVGVLLYSDPKDFAKKGRNDIYPDSWWMPGMAVQSGTVYLGNGDPLTPFYPAVESAYRIPESEALLPSIAVQPIGYDEAELLLQAMGGPPAPDQWQGDLEPVYSLGPGFKYGDGWKLEMDMQTANKLVTTYNTIGMLYGQEEPDRYVLVGNHRDAWTLGALDPSSGTACMLEMARTFGKVKQDYNWRPRRSLIFCSWGAEEYGLIGSYEWVEEHAKVLSQRAVAYLNVDIAVEGNYSLWGSGAPLMNKVYLDSSKRIANPSADEVAQKRPTVFDTWVHRYPDANHPTKPKVNILGSGSDYTAFMHVLGVPAIDIRYTYEEDIGSYPLYHTLYETHHLLADIMDVGFLHHRAVTQLWAEVARNLLESVVLPLDPDWYATYLAEQVAGIQSRYGSQLEANNATMKYFQLAVTHFGEAVRHFQNTTLANLDTSDVLAVRRVNDQLMQLERHFIDPHGLPNRPEYNHIVFAPSSSDGYSSSSFSGLTDLLEAVGEQTIVQKPVEWAQIQQHLSVIAFYIEAAAKSLSDHI